MSVKMATVSVREHHNSVVYGADGEGHVPYVQEQPEVLLSFVEDRDEVFASV